MHPHLDDIRRELRSRLEALYGDRLVRLVQDNDLHEVAISRAYYSMFYIAETFLLEKKLAFSSHSAVIGKFGEHFTKTEELPVRFHRYLIDGFADRVESDYEISPSVSPEDAVEMIDQAEQFIALAEEQL